MENLHPNKPTIGLKLIDVITSIVGFEHENESISLRVVTQAHVGKGTLKVFPKVPSQKKKMIRRKFLPPTPRDSRRIDESKEDCPAQSEFQQE